MSRDFYRSTSYRERQSALTKAAWASGLLDSVRKPRERRFCKRLGCGTFFDAPRYDPKVYCTRSCAAKTNNSMRGPLPKSVKLSIAASMRGKVSPFKGVFKIPRKTIECKNATCKRAFVTERWMTRKFCSNQCAMSVIGGKPTSPRAARGKAGVREDINLTSYFYSRWEANMARLFNFFGLLWVHQPATFNIGSQNYTPDFYLPQLGTYIEVKNFLGAYSQSRDERFRRLYPRIKLMLLLKVDYRKLEMAYAPFIKNWEYKNSKFEQYEYFPIRK